MAFFISGLWIFCLCRRAWIGDTPHITINTIFSCPYVPHPDCRDTACRVFPKKVAIYRNLLYLCDVTRKITYYKTYFQDFFNSLEKGAQIKVTYVLRYIQQTERWNQKFVKHLKDGVFELRAEHNGNAYRVFFILDNGNIVVLFNGFQKKTQKTPPQELEKAIKLKKLYYESK